MQYLSLTALKLALNDLFTHRHAALVMSNAGKTYEPVLLEKKAAIDALPQALTGGKPLADALDDADDLHDGIGGAIWYLTEAHLRHPKTSAEMRAAIGRIRAGFISQLDDLRASYAVEATSASEHRANLTLLESDLKMVPVANGLSLHDWCVDFVDAGESIGNLLTLRADQNPGSRKEASQLRSTTLGLLRRFRTALADEASGNKNLPKDLDANIFGLFDELANMRSKAQKPATTSESNP